MASSSSLALSPSAESAVCTIELLGKASAFLCKPDGNQVGAACEAVKTMLLHKIKSLIAAANGQPILSTKSCDGTPVRATVYHSTTLPSGKKVKGQGKAGREILVSNQFVRFFDAADGWQTSVLFAEPVPLTLGKAVPEILAASRQTWKSLRSLGAVGITVEHYCWGRAGIEALERECRRWHASQPLPASEKYSPATVKSMELVVVTPCALHDGHNSFRWAFLDQCKNRSLMRDLYVSVESLRNSADVITSHMTRWVFSVLQFVDARSGQWKEEQRMLWQALDVDPEIIELMVGELELCWSGDRLCVRSGAQVVMCGVSFAGAVFENTKNLFSFSVHVCEPIESVASTQGWRQRPSRDSGILPACMLEVQEMDGKPMADRRLGQSCFGRCSSAGFGRVFQIPEAGDVSVWWWSGVCC